MSAQPSGNVTGERGLASVSCVIPCYNCVDSLRRAVASVQAQTIALSQIILVDDCSRDGTRQLMEQLAGEDSRIITHALPTNSGPSRARNAGWEIAEGEFIAFLDADDSWLPCKIDLQLRALAAAPDTVIIGHLAAVVGEDAEGDFAAISDAALMEKTIRIDRKSVLIRNPWSTPTVLIKKDISFRFDEDQRAAEDYLLWAQIILSGAAGLKINLPLALLHKARYGAGGLSGNLWEMEKGELLTIGKLHKRGFIAWWERPILSTYSFLKYLKRAATAK